MYSQLIQRDINILRMNRQLRLLWPDYQVRDLLQQKTNLSDLHLITSNPILICKVDLSSKDIPQAIFSKNYSHLAVHKVIQLNEDFSPTPHYYAILSRRGFAVDELHSRYIRGNHIITAKIAQLQRQCNLWGAMSITSEERIIDSKYIVKRNNMWILQFESSKALKSILFYGTIRQPRYGKASGYNNELAKDAKLQFCMHVRNFQSFLDGFMNNLEEPIQTFHFFSSNYIHRIQMPNLFTKSSKTQKNIGKNQSQIKSSNSKTKFPLQVLKQQNSNKNQLKKPSSNQTLITIIQHCLDIQIHEQQANLFQIMQPFDDDLFLNSLLNQIDGRPETKRQMELFIEKIMEKSELNITTVQKASQFKELSSNQSFNYIISVMTKIFITNSCKDIQIWLQLYVNIKKINSQQTKIILTKKLEHYFLNNYRQLLKNCLEQYIYQNIHLIEHLLRRQIARDLANYSNDSGQLSDILYILMNLEGKKDILQLYDLYKLANHSIYVAQSLRNYQISSKIFPKDNSNLLYENLTKINVVQYNSNNENQGNNQKRRPMQQFINLFTLHFSYSFQKNSFLSGKIIQIGNLMLKYYVWREEEYIHCFFQKINDQFNPTKNHLQMVYSFQIQVEMTIGSVKKQHCLSWNFSSPSHSVGYRYIITDTLQKVLVSYKATFKRAIFHQSILSYLKIRYQQSICSQNHPRQRLQSLNKKLSSRRSSLYLERNILGLESAQPLNNQCFYHKDCEQCIKTVKQNFIFHLRPLDLYSLLFSIRFNDEADALSVLFKYLLLNNQPQNNHLFWVSLLRIKYLSLTALLQTANNYAISTKIKPILSSLIEQKIIESCPSSKKIKPKFLFINGQASRRGDIFWRWIQKDYSEQYLQYLNNALQKL